MKSFFKRTIGLILGCVLILGLTSCMGPYAVSQSEAEQLLQTKELDLTTIFTEDGGFSYPGYKWGQSFADFQKAAGYPVTDLESYLSDGGSLFRADKLKIRLLGRLNDEGQVGVTEDDHVIFVSMAFSDGNNIKPTEQELYDQYLAKIIALYGEPTRVTDTEELVGSVKHDIHTVFWDYRNKDSYDTTLQFATSTIRGATKPSTVMLGFSVKEPKTNE